MKNPEGYQESAEVAREGAETAKAARLRLEQSTGKPVVNPANAKGLQQAAQQKKIDSQPERDIGQH